LLLRTRRLAVPPTSVTRGAIRSALRIGAISLSRADMSSWRRMIPRGRSWPPHITKAVAVAALAGLGYACGDGSREFPARATDTTVVLHTQPPASGAFRAAVQAALPTLTFVQVEAFPRASGGPVWLAPPDREPMVGSGSGFVFRSDGHILTNNHVVAEAATVSVVLSDNRRIEAIVVGRDPDTDIAVLRVDAGGDLAAARLGNSDSLQVGDWVLALGYPLGLSATVTAGIVSGTGRSLGIVAQNSEAVAPLEYFIQTDAAINPGNSGGPMVDLAGRVVGVNSAIASPTGYYSGYAFAVPINLARRVAEDLIRYGEVRRPRLGIQITAVTPADAEVYDLPGVEGAEIVAISDDSPAADAGVSVGDVIIAIDSAPVRAPGELQAILARRRPGETVRLHVIRFGEQLEMAVTLGRFPGRALEPAPEVAHGPTTLGFTVDDGQNGVFVAAVERYTPAARAGIRPRQRLISFDRRPVRSRSDFDRALRAVLPGAAVSVRVDDPDIGETIVNFRPVPTHQRRSP